MRSFSTLTVCRSLLAVPALLALAALPGCGAWIVDNDLDGVAAAEDCDDDDGTTWPGAAELCDGVDNDCDGLVDEDPQDAAIWYADDDGDGFGDPTRGLATCNPPSTSVVDASDCDDLDASVNPGATELCDGVDNDCDGLVDGEDDSLDAGADPTWYADEDGDGHGDSAVALTQCTPPTGYVATSDDCDDNAADIHPDAVETCDDQDNDCDGEVDESGTDGDPVWFLDADGDGFGDGSGLDGTWSIACFQPAGFVVSDLDCDDSDSAIHPGAVEICDGVDNDCEGTVDQHAADASTWYQDLDGDGFGNRLVSSAACTAPTGTVADDTDCNDSAAAIFPGADEFCNGVDDDCDGQVDEGDAVDASTWFLDLDRDGWGDAVHSTTACSQPDGYVATNIDCDDADPATWPGADELCDGRDNDCDGAIDEDPGLERTWYLDDDGDGYGLTDTTLTSCAQPTGYTAMDGDCDDTSIAVHPDADEYCDGVDTDCDGVLDNDDALDASVWYADKDGDGYGDVGSSLTACTAMAAHVDSPDDCDDMDALTSPAAAEICDGRDNDCDGDIDEDAAGLRTWYVDTDGDGFGDDGNTVEDCAQPTGTVTVGDDCDDGDAAINPAADEYCDGVDNDCDGLSDGPDSLDAATWYTDGDGDYYGDAANVTLACSQPSGTVANGADCDDSDANISPAASEVCNGLDDDCDGTLDVDAVDMAIWYADKDGDGVGVDGETAEACVAPEGYVATAGDCDDGEPSVYPTAPEICDSLDNDCDGLTDDGDDVVVDPSTWWLDKDGDGFGSEAEADSFLACLQPSSYLATGGDCDDGDAAVNPAASEICNGFDDDCDELKDDDDDSLDTSTGDFYRQDSDGDGYGADDTGALFCDWPSGWVDGGGDCDDAAAGVNPDATDWAADGVDNDCDGDVDFMYASEGRSTWYGADAGDNAGKTVAAAGDVNGDGFDDLLIGAEKATSGGINPGIAYLVLGSLSGLPLVATDVSTADATLVGLINQDSTSVGLAGAGDVNGDGYADLLIGAYKNDTSFAGTAKDIGAAYLFFGPVSGSLSMAAADGALLGAANDDDAGFALSSAGDVDGDGDDDFLVGAPGGDVVYLYMGSATAPSGVLGTAGYVITGEKSNDKDGYALAGGDFDADGYSDVVVGASDRDLGGTKMVGAAYVVLGPVNADVDLGNADLRLSGVAANDKAGSALAAGADVNGDGYGDLLAGAPGATNGKVYLCFGFAGPSGSGPVTASFTDCDAELDGALAGSEAGSAVSFADYDGDGLADLLIGAPKADVFDTDDGAAWLVFGSTTLTGALSLPLAGLKLVGDLVGDGLGTSVAGVGDADGDGFGDLLVGASGEDTRGGDAGAAYLFTGRER